MAYYSVIIYGRQNPDDIHKFVEMKNKTEYGKIQIEYYGMCVKGNVRSGSSAVGRMGAIVKVDAETPQDLIHVLQDSPAGDWGTVIQNA